MCVCVCVCARACVWMSACACMHICVHACTFAYVTTDIWHQNVVVHALWCFTHRSALPKTTVKLLKTDLMQWEREKEKNHLKTSICSLFYLKNRPFHRDYYADNSATTSSLYKGRHIICTDDISTMMNPRLAGKAASRHSTTGKRNKQQQQKQKRRHILNQ